MSGRWHWPLSAPFIGLLLGAFALLLALLQVGVLSYVYSRLGLSAPWAFAILAASLIGSGLNLRVGTLHGAVPAAQPPYVSRFGVRYPVPTVWRSKSTVVAVNVGGALVPSALALYLIAHDNLGPDSLWAIAAVALGAHLLARPVERVGIALPGILPPLFAALVAFLLGGPHIPALAYVGGVLGVLIGADLTNLRRAENLGAPVVSIGGAGTFDGVFLTGILAVLIASL